MFQCRFAAGRPTALVVDSGASYTTVNPVYDGIALQTGRPDHPSPHQFPMPPFLTRLSQCGSPCFCHNLLASSLLRPPCPAVMPLCPPPSQQHSSCNARLVTTRNNAHTHVGLPALQACDVAAPLATLSRKTIGNTPRIPASSLFPPTWSHQRWAIDAYVWAWTPALNLASVTWHRNSAVAMEHLVEHCQATAPI